MRDLQKLAQYAARRKRSRVFRGVLTAIAAVVVFCTTYALILPAITLEGQSVYCGFEDHTHTEDCYQLACGKEEFIPHYHSAECRDENGNLVCHQEETTIHVHSDACKVALTCTQQEREAHAHTEGCFETQSVLTCGIEEAPGHTHGDGCYQTVNVCGQEENPGHAHGEGCYAEDGSLVCAQEESEGHSHTEACFTRTLVCTQEETQGHSHTEECYQAQSVLVCQKEEGEGHTHTDGCYGTFDDFRCGHPEGKEVHEHTASCSYLACDAHVHTEECYVKPQEKEENKEEEPEKPGYILVCDSQDENHVHSESCYVEEVDWADSDAAEMAGFLLTCDEEVEHIHTQECYVPVDLLAANNLLPVSTFNQQSTAREGEGEAVAVPLQSAAKVTLSGEKAEYNIYDGKYYLNFHTNALFQVAKDDQGRKYITANGQNCGLTFTLNLGKMEVTGQLDKEVTIYKEGEMAANRIYSKNEDGDIILTVTLLDSFVQKCDNKISLDTELGGTLSKTNQKSDGSLEYETPDGVKLVVDAGHITYPKGSSKDGDVSVNKNGNFDVKGNTLTYTVEISTNHGTPGDVQVEDVLDAKGLPVIGPPTIKIDNVELDSSQYQYSKSEDGKHTLNFTVDAINTDWSKRIITYVYQMGELPEGTTMVDNSVSASSHKDDPETKITVTASKEVSVTPADLTPALNKETLWNEESASQNLPGIPWKLTINANKMNLVGIPLTDTKLKDCLTDSSGSRQMVVCVNGAEVTDYSSHFTISEDGTITFTPDENNVNTNTYEITYYTPIPDDFYKWGEQTVDNEAVLGRKKVTATATQDNGGVKKESAGITVTNGVLRMNWKVTIDAAEEGIQPEYTLEDYLGWNHRVDPNSLSLSYNDTTLSASDYSVRFFNNGGMETDAANGIKMLITFVENSNLTVGKKQLVLTYTTTASKPDNWTEYDNTVTYRDRSAYSKVAYAPNQVIKTDGKDSHDLSSVVNKDGTLTWKVKVVAGTLSSADRMTVVDTLPAHVGLLSLKANTHAPNKTYYENVLTIGEDGGISGSNAEFSFSGSCELKTNDDGVKYYEVTVNVLPAEEGAVLPAGTELTLTLNCQIDEPYRTELGDGKGTFQNSAQGILGMNLIGEDSQTQTWELPVLKKLDKAGSWNGSARTMNYSLMINPYGNDLDLNSDLLYLTDEFTYYPKRADQDMVYTLLKKTVILYDASLDDEGNLVKGKPTQRSWRWTEDEEVIDDLGNSTDKQVKKILRLEVPDSAPFILEYSYWLADYNGDKDYLHLNAVNSAYFNMSPQSVEKVDFQNAYWNVSEAIDKITTDKVYKITKVEEGNNQVLLPGTVFQVYEAKYDSTKGKWEWDMDHPVYQDTTDAAGTITVMKNDKYQTNTLYKILEVTPVSGYFISSGQPELKFYFGDADDKVHTLPADTDPIMHNAKNLYLESAYATVTNTPEKAKFSVEKIWKDYSGNRLDDPPLDDIRLTVRRVAAEKKQNSAVNDPLASTVTVRIAVSGWQETATEHIYKVPKGTVFTVNLTQPTNHPSPEAYSYLPNSDSKTQKPFSQEDGIYSLTFTATYSICFDIYPKAESGYYTCSISHSAQSSGNTGEETTSRVFDPVDYETIWLTKQGQWKWSSTDSTLGYPVRGTETITEEGVEKQVSVWYSYYVVEDLPGYTVTYSNQNADNSITGVTSGNITVTNTQPENPPTYASISVEKTWQQAVESQLPDSVRFKLYRKEWAGEIGTLDAPYGTTYDSLAETAGVTLIGEYQLTKTGNWEWSSAGEGLSLLASSQEKHYTYFILEEPSESFDISYGTGSNRENSGGSLTLTNTMHPSYILPETGGTGTGIYTIAGLTLTAGAVLGLMKKRRKGERD